MAGEPKHRDWIKLWIKESLLGTIREDLTPEERGTWYDFLLLAGHSRIPGTICANENTALPVKRIAGILNTPDVLIRKCIKKFKDSGRIEIDRTGVIRILNWERYQYTDYDRQKPYRAQKKLKEDEIHGYVLEPGYTMEEVYGENWEEEERQGLVRQEPLEVHQAAIEVARQKELAP